MLALDGNDMNADHKVLVIREITAYEVILVSTEMKCDGVARMRRNHRQNNMTTLSPSTR